MLKSTTKWTNQVRQFFSESNFFLCVCNFFCVFWVTFTEKTTTVNNTQSRVTNVKCPHLYDTKINSSFFMFNAVSMAYFHHINAPNYIRIEWYEIESTHKSEAEFFLSLSNRWVIWLKVSHWKNVGIFFDSITVELSYSVGCSSLFFAEMFHQFELYQYDNFRIK